MSTFLRPSDVRPEVIQLCSPQNNPLISTNIRIHTAHNICQVLEKTADNVQSSTDVIPPPLTRRSVQNARLPFFALAPSFPGIRFSPLCASLSVRVNHSSYSCFHRGDRICYFIKSTLLSILIGELHIDHAGMITRVYMYCMYL